MDLVTDAQVAIAVTVAVPRERMWHLITDVEQIGEWSPEAIGGTWETSESGLFPGARFIGRNRYANGFVSTVTCVVTEADELRVFAWNVLDADGYVGSMWRYELCDGDEPETTVVHHSFTHGPGNTGVREGAVADPESLSRRLGELCRNMTMTIAAMASTEMAIGVSR